MKFFFVMKQNIFSAMPLNSSHLLLALQVFSASTRRSLCVMIRTAFSHARIQFNFISFVIAIIFLLPRNFRVGKMCLNEALEFIFGWRSCDENKYFSFLSKLRRKWRCEHRRVQKYFLHNFSRFILLIRRADPIVWTFQSSAQLTSISHLITEINISCKYAECSDECCSSLWLLLLCHLPP